MSFQASKNMTSVSMSCIASENAEMNVGKSADSPPFIQPARSEKESYSHCRGVGLNRPFLVSVPTRLPEFSLRKSEGKDTVIALGIPDFGLDPPSNRLRNLPFYILVILILYYVHPFYRE